MSDMRATERLLEVIGELVESEISVPIHLPFNDVETSGTWIRDTDMTKIRDALTELRRRGDTLVRRDDLRIVVEHMSDPFSGGSVHADSVVGEARDRLENAIGGKL